MDYEGLDDKLKERFDQYCTDNSIEATDSDFEVFMDMAKNRIKDIMSGGLDMEEAYEWYLDEINDDLSFVLVWEGDEKR